MNSFEVQSEADAQLERQRSLHSQAKSSNSYNTGSMMSQFSSLIPPQAPPPPPPSVSSQNRLKAQIDSKRLIDPNGNIVNVIEDHKYAVFISCIEIYNNYIYDLLDDSNITSADSAK